MLLIGWLVKEKSFLCALFALYYQRSWWKSDFNVLSYFCFMEDGLYCSAPGGWAFRVCAPTSWHQCLPDNSPLTFEVKRLPLLWKPPSLLQSGGSSSIPHIYDPCMFGVFASVAGEFLPDCILISFILNPQTSGLLPKITPQPLPSIHFYVLWACRNMLKSAETINYWLFFGNSFLKPEIKLGNTKKHLMLCTNERTAFSLFIWSF